MIGAAARGRPWPERIFCDTSYFFACLEPRDIHHQKAVEWLESSRRHRTVYFSTWDVLSESVTLLRRKSGHARAMRFVDRVVPALQLVAVEDSLRLEALEVFKRFGRDKKLSFCDCLSYVVLTTVLENIPTATFDGHFASMGLPVLVS